MLLITFLLFLRPQHGYPGEDGRETMEGSGGGNGEAFQMHHSHCTTVIAHHHILSNTRNNPGCEYLQEKGFTGAISGYRSEAVISTAIANTPAVTHWPLCGDWRWHKWLLAQHEPQQVCGWTLRCPTGAGHLHEHWLWGCCTRDTSKHPHTLLDQTKPTQRRN